MKWRKVYITVFVLSSLIWYLIFIKSFTDTIADALGGAVICSCGMILILGSIREFVRRYHAGEALIKSNEPKPKKLPIWYRFLSKFFD